MSSEQSSSSNTSDGKDSTSRPTARSDVVKHVPNCSNGPDYPFFPCEFSLVGETLDQILDHSMDRCLALESEALSFHKFVNKYFFFFRLDKCFDISLVILATNGFLWQNFFTRMR